MMKCCKQSIKALEEDIKKTEEEIKKVIDNDEKLKELFSIIESVPGIGKITATEIVINTNDFKKINDQENMHVMQVLPLSNITSGTSVRGKTRTGRKANMKAKSLLHMTALVVARFSDDLREYYEIKVAEGKNKMNVLKRR